MKKKLMISVMLLVGALSVSAQTYCYKWLYSINGDGVKSKGSSTEAHYIYITFTNNKNVCYESDKDGYAKYSGTGNKAIYEKTENGVHEFVQKRIKTAFMTVGGGYKYRFSSDFSRMNYWNTFNSDCTRWDVYERTAEPENQKTPIQLY